MGVGPLDTHVQWKQLLYFHVLLIIFAMFISSAAKISTISGTLMKIYISENSQVWSNLE